MLVRLENGDLKDVTLAEVTAENYIVNDNERGFYHCLIEIEQWDRGKKISKPRIQLYGQRYFDSGGYEEILRQGYKLSILYNPNRTEEDIQREKEERARKIAEAEARKEAELQAAVNDTFKKMISTGIIKGSKEDAENLIKAGVISRLPSDSVLVAEKKEPKKK